MSAPPAILLRLPNWLGDTVMALPALQHLRETFPAARILVAVRPPLALFMAAQEGVAGVVEAPGPGWLELGRHCLAPGRTLAEIDLAVLFTNSFASAFWTWRLGARRRLGYDRDGRRLFLTHPLPCGRTVRQLHCLDYYLALSQAAARVLGAPTDAPPPERLPRPTIAPDWRSQAERLLGERGVDSPFAVLAPFSAFGAVKDWPFAYYQRLVRELSERRGLRVLLSGTASQAARARELAQSHPRALSLAGDTDLGTFAAVLERAALFVGGDSGGAHLAAALAIPTLVIFGLTDPSRTGQTGPRVAILGGKPGEELRGGRARRVAAEELSSIGVETVWESLESLENGK